jgi:hypothetical protein
MNAVSPKDIKDHIGKLNAEIDRLRSIVLKPKRIEWVQEDDTLWGLIDNDELFKILTFKSKSIAFRVNARSVKDWLEFDEYFETVESAKAACQSALDTWVMQFMEPIS